MQPWTAVHLIGRPSLLGNEAITSGLLQDWPTPSPSGLGHNKEAGDMLKSTPPLIPPSSAPPMHPAPRPPAPPPLLDAHTEIWSQNMHPHVGRSLCLFPCPMFYAST